jgi:hypothetical protein
MDLPTASNMVVASPDHRQSIAMTTRWRRNDKILFIGAAALSFALVLIRAWTLPPVNDAARAFFLFNETGRIFPGEAVWDAANHLLSTWATQLAYLVLGPSLASLRLFSILSALVYFRYVHAVGTWILHRPVRWLLWLAMLFPPLLLEFFSLYRGYGPGLAFFLMGIWHTVEYARTGARAHWLWALVGVLLAAYATLTLLVPWCLVLAILPLLKPKAATGSAGLPKRLAEWFALGILPLAFLTWFGLELTRHGALYYGTAEGFWSGTVASVYRFMFPGHIPVTTLAIIWFALLLRTIWKARGLDFHDARQNPMVLIAVLLTGEMAGFVMLHWTSGTLLPMNRTAMHLVLPFVLLAALVVDDLANRNPAWQLALSPLLAFPWNTFMHFDPTRTTIWPEDGIGREVHGDLAAFTAASGRIPSVGASLFLKESWALQGLDRNSWEPALQEVSPGCDGTDFLVLRPSDTALFQGYHRVSKSDRNAVALFARDRPLPLQLVFDTIIPHSTGKEEWIPLWNVHPAILPCQRMLVELKGAISSSARPLEAQLVWETGRGAHSASWENLDLALLRTSWHDDTLRNAHLLQWTDSSDWIKVYIWNIREQPLNLTALHLRAYCIAGDQ